VVGGDVGAERRDWLGHASRLLNREVRSPDRMGPHGELCSGGAYCLADPGREYVVYAPPEHGGRVIISLPGNSRYRVRFYNPRTGEMGGTSEAGGGPTTLELPDARDWVLSLSNARA
jgi:hypothetical protein